MFDFCIFSVMLVHMSVINLDNVSHFELSVYFWQIRRLAVLWWALRFFTIWRNGTKKLFKFRVMIRHQLWAFWENLDRLWRSSTSPERCACGVVFAQNLVILKQTSTPHVSCLKHPQKLLDISRTLCQPPSIQSRPGILTFNPTFRKGRQTELV